MNDKNHDKLDLSKLNYSEKETTSEEDLSDLEPIQWPEEVLNEERKVVVSKNEYDKKNDEFNEFLKINKERISEITPKNPVIKKDDEWNDDKYDFF